MFDRIRLRRDDVVPAQAANHRRFGARHFVMALSRLLVAMAAALAAAHAPAAEHVEWLGATEIASGRGERGPWRQNDSRFAFVDDPTVAIDARGDILVAWVDQARKDVLLQRLAPDGTRRGEPANV
jgi:hypothetical protein